MPAIDGMCLDATLLEAGRSEGTTGRGAGGAAATGTVKGTHIMQRSARTFQQFGQQVAPHPPQMRRYRSDPGRTWSRPSVSRLMPQCSQNSTDASSMGIPVTIRPPFGQSHLHPSGRYRRSSQRDRSEVVPCGPAGGPLRRGNDAVGDPTARLVDGPGARCVRSQRWSQPCRQVRARSSSWSPPGRSTRSSPHCSGS